MTSSSAPSRRDHDNCRPKWGQMDVKLAQWLAGGDLVEADAVDAGAAGAGVDLSHHRGNDVNAQVGAGAGAGAGVEAGIGASVRAWVGTQGRITAGVGAWGIEADIRAEAVAWVGVGAEAGTIAGPRAAAAAVASTRDASASLAAALRAAETRVAALETDVRELEADLYAASVLWGETEADNTSLHAQVLDPSTPLNPKP